MLKIKGGVGSYFLNDTLFIVFLLMLFNYCLYPQSNEKNIKDGLVNDLVKSGYENVGVAVKDGDLIVMYENRLYRFELDALKDIVKIIDNYAENFQNILLVPQNRQIPLLVVKINSSDLRAYCKNDLTPKEFGDRLNINLDTDEIKSFLQNEEIHNSSVARTDITLKPSFQFQFGPYSDPVLWQFNLVPGIRTSFWKGMHFDYEAYIPLHNDLSPREDSVRTGLAVINQTFRLPNNYFISTSAGYFTGYRYGFDFESRKYFDNGNSYLNFNFGCTSFATFAGTRLYYSDQFLWTVNANFNYRIPEYDLTLGVMAGKFLSGDESIRFDINREFGEIEIGFFAIRSREGVSNGGINITIPLFPSKYWKPSVLRIRPDENFAFSYLVKTSPKDIIGLRYNTGNRLDNFDKKLNPDFIKNVFREDFK